MYMGDPQRVAAIMLVWRYLAKPKSAGTKPGEDRGWRKIEEEEERGKINETMKKRLSVDGYFSVLT